MKKAIYVFALILLFINGIGALFGGWGLIGDPTGTSMGWTTAMLQHSLFNDYLIPGIILFTANGLSSLIIAFFTIRKNSFYPQLIMIQGYILSGWIIIQILMIRQVHMLHFICGIIGVSLISAGIALIVSRPKKVNFRRQSL